NDNNTNGTIKKEYKRPYNRQKRYRRKPIEIKFNETVGIKKNNQTFNESVKEIALRLRELICKINNKNSVYKTSFGFRDLFYFMSIKRSNNFSNIMALQQLRNKCITRVSESAIRARLSKINWMDFRDMFNALLSFVSSEINTLNNNTNKVIDEKIYATDGTTLNFTKKINGISFAIDKNKRYVKG